VDKRPGIVRLAACVLALALAGLTGCGQPSWRDPATSKGSAEVAPEVRKALGLRDAAIPPASPSRYVTTDPLPAAPAWAAVLINQPLDRAFPKTARCLGNTDGVKVRYAGAVRGVRLAGWAWDPVRREPLQHVVIRGADSTIVGAGEGGKRRLDVPRVVPDVISDVTGWEAVTWRYGGPVDIFGVLADGQTICRLGHIVL
jgi:hypothetical protein